MYSQCDAYRIRQRIGLKPPPLSLREQRSPFMDVGKSKLKCDIFVAGGPGQCYIIAVRTVQWFQLVQRVATQPGLESMAEYVLCSSTVSPLTSFRAFAKSTSATANKPNIQVVTTMNQLVQNSSGISDKISKPGQRIHRCPQVQDKFLYFHSKGGGGKWGSAGTSDVRDVLYDWLGVGVPHRFCSHYRPLRVWLTFEIK